MDLRGRNTEGMLNETLSRLLAGPVAPRQAVNVRLPAFALMSDVGLTRHENQDRAIVAQVGRLHPDVSAFTCLAVSDGMGGMFAGEACAIITLSAFVSGLVSSRNRNGAERLIAAARIADSAVHAFAQGKGGATLSAVLVEETGRAWHLNVGDSRIYIVSDARQRLERITVDDNLQEAFGGHGKELVQFIGIGSSLLPRVGELPPSADQVYITSDGAHYFSPELLQELVIRAGDPKRAAERIIAVSRWLGGPDNATVAAFRPRDLVSTEVATDSAVRVWTPSETTNIVLVPMAPFRQSGPHPESQRPQQADAHPESFDRASSARTARTATRRPGKNKTKKKGGQDREEPQPELLVTVSSDEPSDAADS